MKGFVNSEEACSSTHTSRQSPFRIDRCFIEIKSSEQESFFFFFFLPSSCNSYPAHILSYMIVRFWAAAVINVLPACPKLLHITKRQFLFEISYFQLFL